MELAGVLLVGFVAGMAAGLLGIGGGALFVPALANALPERALEVSCAMLQLFVAFQLARRALRTEEEETA